MLSEKTTSRYGNVYVTLSLAAILFIYTVWLILRTEVDVGLHIQSAIATLHERPKYFSLHAPSPSRLSDTTDVFADYRHQNICHISSLDLHVPFDPPCSDMRSVLEAMSWGGRPGFNAPYMPRGCDMRFYSSAEMCEILSRFSAIHLGGDSIIRHVSNVFWLMMRGDMGYGTLQSWNLAGKVGKTSRINRTEDCACDAQMDKTYCSFPWFQEDWDGTAGSRATDADRLHVCAKEFPTKIWYQALLSWPVNSNDLKILLGRLPEERPAKPVAVIMGHGLWNNMNLNRTALWMDQVLETLDKRPYTSEIAKLFLSTSAGGPGKPGEWLGSQSVQKMAEFEIGVRPLVEARDIDFLGTYNMSVQASSFDGTHASL